jgi:hypothetical protein
VSLRTSLLPVVHAIRGIAGPAGLDQRPNSLTLTQRDWSGGRKDLGTSTDTLLITFPGYLPIHQLTEKDVADSGGRYIDTDLAVSRILPYDSTSGLGYTPAQLDPTVTSDGTEFIYNVSGPLAGDFSLVEIRSGGRAAHVGGYPGYGGVYSYALVLRRRRHQ